MNAPGTIGERNFRALSRMPEFSVTGYADLLDALQYRQVALRPVSAMASALDGPTAYLRHDIDLHVPGIERVARIEADRGVSATYFVMLTQHYNALYGPNVEIFRELVAMGHELGLHYDLMAYPQDQVSALEQLHREVGLLSGVVGVDVSCISMHQPFEGRPDYFRDSDDYVHPHDPRYGAGLAYVSDSCRAWRDETLVDFLNADSPDRRLLLLTHPELWLDGAIADRMQFLETSLTQNTVAQHSAFIDQTVRGVWSRHPGPALHDQREERLDAG